MLPLTACCYLGTVATAATAAATAAKHLNGSSRQSGRGQTARAGTKGDAPAQVKSWRAKHPSPSWLVPVSAGHAGVKLGLKAKILRPKSSSSGIACCTRRRMFALGGSDHPPCPDQTAHHRIRIVDLTCPRRMKASGSSNPPLELEAKSCLSVSWIPTLHWQQRQASKNSDDSVVCSEIPPTSK